MAENETLPGHEPGEDFEGALREAFGPESAVSGKGEASVLEILEERSGARSTIFLREGAAEAVPLKPVSSEIPPDLREVRHYRILGEIARGGLGVILKARDTNLGRDAAMKMLLSDYERDPQMVRRFVEEAQIGGQLHHPGIVPVYEMGILGDCRPYFTMKLVNGQTLSALLEARSDPLSERRRFLAMFEQVCQAVAYAHSRGVIHRDLKPANVMVGTFGEVQVMDWGLSRVLSGPGRKSAPEGNLLLGTPGYMPPEQARGRVDELDERSDVFGLGAILCELLTGKPPYTGTGAEVRRKAAQGDLDEAVARLEAAGVDAQLLSIARKCLSPAPADRFADAGELARDFTAYLGSVEERARTAVVAAAEARGKAQEERRACRLTLYLAVSILAATILGTGGYLVMENDRRQRGRATAGEVARALEEARLHWGEARAAPEDFARWGKAMTAARSAQSVARVGGVDAVTQARVDELLEGLSREETAARQGATKREAERKVVEALDDIRLRRDDLVRYGWKRVDEEYARAFREFGLEVDSLSVDDAAQRIRGCDRTVEISAGLDDWARIRRNLGLAGTEPWKRLSNIARLADPDPLKTRLREAWQKADLEALREVAHSTAILKVPPSTINFLAESLESVGDPNEAGLFLRRAQEVYPGDFWINENLGLWLVWGRPRDHAEGLRFLSAALALRPQAATAWNNLGSLLLILRRLDEGIAACSRAVELDPLSPPALSNLGGALLDRGDLDGALALLEKAVAIDPTYAQAQGNLGAALKTKGDLDRALKACLEAVRRIPTFDEARLNLVDLFEAKGRYAEALDQLGQLEGWALREPKRGSWREAKLKDLERLAGVESRLEAVLRGEDQPREAAELRDFAELCYARGLYARSAGFWQAAFERDPTLADDPRKSDRYNAACAASLAATSQVAKDGRAPGDEDRARLRLQAREWLRADFEAWRGLLAGDEKELEVVRKTFEHWKRDPDLAGLRDAAALEALPPEEKEACRKLWAEVDALLGK